MKKIILLITLSLAFIITGCGSSKKDDEVIKKNEGNRNTQNMTPIMPEEQMITQEELESQASEELGYALRSSHLNIKEVQNGRTVFIQCSTFLALDEINLCRVGFSQREIAIGSHIIRTGRSEDLYNSIYNENLKARLMNGDMLGIKCKKRCILSEIPRIRRQQPINRIQ